MATLAFLLDEHLSPDLAAAARRMRPKLRIVPLRDWHTGLYLGASDEAVLAAAYQDGMTLVAYDHRTVVPLLKYLAERERPHRGVVLVDGRTLAPRDVGGLARALAALWDASHRQEWTNRVVYLTRA